MVHVFKQKVTTIATLPELILSKQRKGMPRVSWDMQLILKIVSTALSRILSRYWFLIH